jgi:hypothetical protein
VWGQWTLANTIGEALGLGATLLAGILLFARLEPRIGPVLSAILGVLAGACVEGGIVGTAQWLVLRGPLAGLSWIVWAAATAIGAGIAWALGLLPTTIISLTTATAENASASPPNPSELVVYSLAAALGLVAGAILALAQWWVLRRFVPRASWWILASAIAWALGMVLVFIGTSFIPDSGVTASVIPILIAFVVLAGATVGAIEGLALIWLLRGRDIAATTTTSAASSPIS